MLALKTVLADRDVVDSMIFDEVDAGVGGSAANKVGRKLKQVSRSRQVICVTHSAQIAAMADTHFQIEKKVSGGRTYTAVRALSEEERQAEVARMIGGSEVTPLTLPVSYTQLSLRRAAARWGKRAWCAIPPYTGR